MDNGVVVYEHHGRKVSVINEEHKGHHREHCLCWQNCVWFTPDNRKTNCPVANALYNICCDEGVTTPVYECSLYREKTDDIG